MIKDQQADRPKCPECAGRMVKAGKVFSGRTKCQMWRCTQCGRQIAQKPEKTEGK